MKKIIIVEDDPIVGHIYQTRLEKEGYEVETCTDGQKGFYRIHEFHPDAVLLDLMLPKMNGVDILKKIRAQSQFQRLPVIVFTNAYVPNMIQEAFGAGATQVFNKATLTPRQVIDSLQAIIQGGFAPTPDNAGTPTPQAPAPSPASSNHSPETLGGESSFHSSAAPASHHAQQPTAAPAQPPVMYTPPPAHAAAPASAVPSLNSDDAEFQAEMNSAFIQAKPEILAGLRKALQDFSKAQDDQSRLPHLLELYRKVHALTSSAGIAGYGYIAQMAAALEVLLKELYEKPKNVNASTMRTVAHSVDFIGEMFKSDEINPADPAPAEILVVDDEILSRRAITYALEKATLKAVSVEDPNVALKLATESRYDLIFLDVQMPNMDGFELCTRIRALPLNKLTPIIFVTSLTDFKSRAKSTLSGGNDLIAKPFMFIELSVKALTYVLRSRLAPKRQAA
jgi:DNA-binding response OmpR family regulator/HPt (histidine-containing phosphotransfer) domain-containing protein